MENQDKGKYLRLAVITLLVVGLDQLTKAMIAGNLHLYQSINVIPGIFNLTYIHNPGGAFGFLASHSPGIRTMVFMVLAILATGFVLYFYVRTPADHKLFAFGLALVFSGAIGNLIDRIRLGTVVDFLDIYIKNLHWPAFNLADSAISIGMVIFVFHLVFKKMPNE